MLIYIARLRKTSNALTSMKRWRHQQASVFKTDPSQQLDCVDSMGVTYMYTVGTTKAQVPKFCDGRVERF